MLLAAARIEFREVMVLECHHALLHCLQMRFHRWGKWPPISTTVLENAALSPNRKYSSWHHIVNVLLATCYARHLDPALSSEDYALGFVFRHRPALSVLMVTAIFRSVQVGQRAHSADSG